MNLNSGDNIETNKSNWDFKQLNTDSFEKHINKSVPSYSYGHQIITFLSDYFISHNSIIYDVGCSSGNLISKLSSYQSQKNNLEFIGLEPAKNFKKKFIENTTICENNHKYEFISEEVQLYNFKKCDLIISYYTMQFLRPMFRQEVIDKIYESLNWGGGFFFFEKVRGSDARFQDMLNSIYFEYKQEMGFSNEEILNKMMSLKGVLEPFSSNENQNFLKRAGFKDIELIFKNLCFEGILAIK